MIPSLRPTGKIRRQRTKSFEITINGLLAKRVLLMREGGRQADIKALDRTLRVLGYDGEIDALMPAESVRVFRNGGLRRACLDVLEAADRPLTSREIAERVYVGRDAEYVARATMRISKCLRADRREGNATATKRDGWALVWEST
jgi:hypothetical protein